MEKYSLKVAVVYCYRARRVTMERLRGSVEAHYARLRSYVSELKRVDREGCFELETSWDSERNMVMFKGIYICFSGLRKVFGGL